MNLNKYNTATACNVPQVCSLKNPFFLSGDLLLDESGNTLDFVVYGLHSDAVRNALRERQRIHGDKEKLSEEEAAQAGAEFLAAAVSGWSSNVENDDGRIEFSRQNAIDLFLSQDWIAGQIRDFCFNLRNFDPKPSGASGIGRARSRGITRTQKSRAKADGTRPGKG